MDRAALDQEALAARYPRTSREVSAAHLVDRGARSALELGAGSSGGPGLGREVQGRGPPERGVSNRSRMSDQTGLAIRFLTSMAQALATMSLYAEGHPARARAAGGSFDTLRDLQRADPRPSFSFLGSEVVYGQQAIRGLTDWEWATKLANVGVQRLEFADMVERDAYVSFLEDVLARVSAFTAVAAANAAANAPTGRGHGPTAIRFGAVGVRGSSEVRLPDPAVQVAEQPSVLDLNAEVDAIRWVHDEVNAREAIPLLEAESIVRSLSVAMHGDSQMLL